MSDPAPDPSVLPPNYTTEDVLRLCLRNTVAASQKIQRDADAAVARAWASEKRAVQAALWRAQKAESATVDSERRAFAESRRADAAERRFAEALEVNRSLNKMLRLHEARAASIAALLGVWDRARAAVQRPTPRTGSVKYHAARVKACMRRLRALGVPERLPDPMPHA